MISRRLPERCAAILRLTMITLLAFAVRSPSAAEIVTAPFRVAYETGSQIAPPLSLPTDVAIDSKGNIYVVDSGNNRVVIFDSDGQEIGSFGSEGDGDGQLSGPVGIGIAPDDSVYIADRGNRRLMHFSALGTESETIPLTEDGEDIVAVDVTVSEDGSELFVTASARHRVVVFSANGNYLRGWGGEGSEDGEFRYPATLTLAGGVLYVVDVLNARVQAFDSMGNILHTFGELNAGPGTFFKPKGIAVDTAGRIYVSDSYLGVVQVFSATGEFLHVLGQDGVAMQFENPVGLTTYDSRLVLVQMLAGSILVLEAEGGQ
jgi:tripartite motif-containing protein 71